MISFLYKYQSELEDGDIIMFLTYSVEFVMLMIFAVVYQQNVTDCYRLLQMHAVYKCRVFHHSLILYPSYILLRISEFCLASRHYLFKMLSCNVCVCVRARVILVEVSGLMCPTVSES